MSRFHDVFGDISTLNSTTSTFGIGGLFEGDAEDVTDFTSITVFIHTDQVSAVNGLQLQFSSNGTDWDRSRSFTVNLNSLQTSHGGVFKVKVDGRFFRVRYTNGGVSQTVFRLQTRSHTADSNEDKALQVTSSVNTTIVALDAAATFTGEFESNDLSDVMVHVEADQDGSLFFDFSQDGTNVDTFPFTGFDHVADIPSFHVAVKGGQMFRIRFTNTSVTNQTFLRIYTYYGSFKKPNAPVGTPINDSTDATTVKAVITGKTNAGNYVNINATPTGNIKATLFDDQTDSRQIVDLNGAAKFGEAIILAGDAFGGKVPNDLQWTTEFVGSGASVVLPGTQRLETGTTADSEARFQSTKKARFMISQFNIYHGGIFLDNISEVDCRRRWGVFDPIAASPNGIFFQLEDGDWSVGTVKNGTETLVAEASWNGVSKGLFNDTPGLAVYEIQYNAGAAFFFQGPNLLHILSVAAVGGTYADSYNFNVALEVVNSNGNTTNNGIEFRAAGCYRLGEERGVLIPRAFTGDTLIKTGSGYVSKVSLSRTGSTGGSGALSVYDGVDNTGILIGQVDVGGDDVKGITLDGTFSDGLFIELSGTGTNTATVGFE